MGSVGANKNTVSFNITSPIRGQEIEGKDIIAEAKESINEIYRDYQDVDRMYEALADYYPRSMPDSDAEKLMKVDLKNGTADFVNFGINEYNSKISVDLSPERFDLDEFNDKELLSFGVKRTGRKYSWE